jgi:hypothetical protein
LATTRAFCRARRWSASLTALSRRRDRITFLSSLLTALPCRQPDSLSVVVDALGRSLPPVLVDAVLQLNDGEVADFDWEGLV